MVRSFSTVDGFECAAVSHLAHYMEGGRGSFRKVGEQFGPSAKDGNRGGAFGAYNGRRSFRAGEGFAMKTLVVGDLHVKQPFVLPAIDGLLATDGEIGRVVFLGDACDDWGATEADELGALGLYARWVAERRERGLQVDVLLGNHDFCYIRGRRGPGSLMSIMRELRAILEGDLHARAACAVGPYLCTHAGVTGVWAKRFIPDLADSSAADACAIARRLNGMLDDSDNWASLDSCPPSRGGWSLPGPLWADVRDMLDDALPGVPQIVGHTPVERVENFAESFLARGRDDLWACDTMSLTSGGAAIGDGSMLLVSESGAASPVAFPGGDYAQACRKYWLGR